MKKLIVIMILISTMAYAYNTYLSSEWVSGEYRYCQYSNGKIITVPQYQVCPHTVKAD